MRKSRPRHLLLKTIITLLYLSVFAGCDITHDFNKLLPSRPASSDVQPCSFDAASVEIPDGDPAELSALIEDSRAEIAELEQLLSTSNLNFDSRIHRFRKHVHTAIAAAEKLHFSDEATEAQQAWAREQQFALFYQAAKRDPKYFRQPFESFINGLHQDDRSRRLRAVGDAAIVELDVRSDDYSPEELLSKLVDFAQDHPSDPVGIALFHQLAERLEADGNRADRMDCYITGIERYGHLPQSKSLREQLDALRRSEQARAEKETRRRKKLDKIRRQLGSHDDGYFLIYAHEVKPPSNKSFELYQFEYEVLQGKSTAVFYVDGLRDNWKWELIRRFEETGAGLRHAQNMAEELTKKRAFVRY